MQSNKTMIKLIAHYESLHDGDKKTSGLQPQMDPIGIWTEGWGHAILDKDGKFVKGVNKKTLAYSLSKVKTEEQADKLLAEDLIPRLKIVEKYIKIKLTDYELAALVSFIYNTGGSSTLYQLINNKSNNLYKWWCSHFITSNGKELKGLIYRRKSEAILFTSGKLQFFN
jgi:lysozyme